MAPQTYDPKTRNTPVTVVREVPAAPAAAPPARPAYTFWALVATAVVLTAGVVALGVKLLAFSGAPAAAPPDRKLEVPFRECKSLWEPFRGWVVQEDGRNKPFDTFCREAVRTVTGRERFEGNDPVAVVVSWMMLNDEDRNRTIDNGRAAGCDWDHYPLIACDFHELREVLYREYRGEDAELTEEERHGRHVEPAAVRNSAQLKKLVREAALRMDRDSKAALPPLLSKALEVKKRADLFERVRSGGGVEANVERVRAAGEFSVVALDRFGRTWFSLASLRHYLKHKKDNVWQETLRARRIEQPAPYKGKDEQPLPEEACDEVLAAYAAAQQAYRSGDEATFAAASGGFLAKCGDVSGRFNKYPDAETTAMELWFNRGNPFQKAWLASLLAALLLAVSVFVTWPLVARAFYTAGLLAYAGSLAFSAVGFYCRVTISGRPPVSNMYESIIWVAFMTAAFGLVMELVYRKGILALAGSLVSTLGLVLADQLPLTFNPSIQPLQAVLRSNYWLIIHVLTIVSSYSAFALAWGLGNINLGLMLAAPGRRDLIKTLTQYSYRAIQVGVILLFLGTMLGGFWAAESWGRFWGWDPKEVWALIAFLCYIIPLHARYIGWVKDFGLAVCAVVCFSAIVMAWYGVNYVLGAGLHSYGFGSGNNAWIYWAGLINIDLVVLGALRYLYSRRVPVSA